VQSTALPTTLTVNAATGDFADATTVSALLTNTNTASPIAGKAVTLTLDGAESCSATTDATGKASCSVTPGEAAGSYPLTAAFAGDSGYQAATGSSTFAVTLEETGLTYTGATSAVDGQPVTLSGVLTTDDPAAGTGLSGKTVTFMLGSGATAQSCSGTTGSDGSVSCVIASVAQTPGAVPVAAGFAGDSYFRPASAATTVDVFAPLATGAFVIGDVSAGSPTAGTAVTFWGAQWAKNNAFSRGRAPADMKGFADSPASAACDGTWTTRPGNDSSPPANLPAQIEVLVTSSVAKSGSTISGNIAHIVLVQVDPGYGPDPGHAGTGTIVATVC
jgi:hypothetical protein